MSEYRVQLELPATSGLPEDRCINTFHFAGAGPATEADAHLCNGAVLAMFSTAFTSGIWTRELGVFLSPEIDRHAIAKCYDNDTPGSPLAEDIPAGSTLPASSVAGALPSEVSVVGSYRADTTGVPENGPTEVVGGRTIRTRPKARRRGRIYFGPCNSDVLFTDSARGVAMPDGKFQSIFAQAMHSLMANASLAGASLEWVVHSSRDGLSRPVVAGFVDDAFDTQRRRGRKTTGRTTF